MVAETKVAEVERERGRIIGRMIMTVDWLNGKSERGVNEHPQVSGLGTLVDHAVSHCSRSTGGRGGLEWCLSNRGNR